jgi:hypothetical protein
MKKGRLLLLCAASLLTACQRDSSQDPAVTPALQPSVPVAAKHGPSPQELTSGMVEAVSSGNAQVPVDVKFDLQQRPTLGQPLEIAIAVIPQIVANQGTVEITASDGLTLPAADGQLEIPSMDAMQVYRRTFKVTPTAEGVQLIGVKVQLKHDDVTESRAFSVPIIVVAAADGAPVVKR